jgi:hypothetical protein
MFASIVMIPKYTFRITCCISMRGRDPCSSSLNNRSLVHVSLQVLVLQSKYCPYHFVMINPAMQARRIIEIREREFSSMSMKPVRLHNTGGLQKDVGGTMLSPHVSYTSVCSSYKGGKWNCSKTWQIVQYFLPISFK